MLYTKRMFDMYQILFKGNLEDVFSDGLVVIRLSLFREQQMTALRQPDKGEFWLVINTPCYINGRLL